VEYKEVMISKHGILKIMGSSSVLFDQTSLSLLFKVTLTPSRLITNCASFRLRDSGCPFTK